MMLKNLRRWWIHFISQLGNFSANSERLVTRSQLRVPTDLNALDEILRWSDQFKHSISAGEMWWCECQTALTEGFTNAVRHAHANLPPTTPIDIEVKVFAETLEIYIWDWGQPFDLNAYLAERIQFPPDPNQENGRGIIMMSKFTDELFYTRSPEQKNCLFMRKRIP